MRIPVLLVLGSCIGCGGGEVGRTPTVPVTGTVHYENTPVVDAVVTFHGGPKQAVARTDATGRFMLTTYDHGDGAVPGKHVVTVTKFEGNAATSSEPVSMEAALDQPTTPQAAKSLLPAKYGDPDKTTIVETVTEGADNHFELKLVK